MLKAALQESAFFVHLQRNRNITLSNFHQDLDSTPGWWFFFVKIFTNKFASQRISVVVYKTLKHTDTMRRLHTKNGTKLGCSFSGDNGRTFHMTTEEALNLFNADTEEEVLDDNCPTLMTVEDLVEDFITGNKASKEEMRRRWDKGMEDSLHMESFQGLDKNGDIQTGFKR